MSISIALDIAVPSYASTDAAYTGLGAGKLYRLTGEDIVRVTVEPSAVPVTTSLIQDLNPENGVSVSGTTLTGWTNSAASGGDDLTVVNGNPQLTTADLNSLDVVSFDGNDSIEGTSTTAFDGMATGSGATVFTVLQGSSTQPNFLARYMGTLNGASLKGFTFNLSHAGLTNSWTYFNNPSNQELYGTTDLDDDNWHIVVCRLSTGTGAQTMSTFIDSATSEASTAMTVGDASGALQLTVGADRTGDVNQAFVGKIARVLMYERGLTDEEVNDVGTYLAELYNLTWA